MQSGSLSRFRFKWDCSNCQVPYVEIEPCLKLIIAPPYLLLPRLVSGGRERIDRKSGEPLRRPASSAHDSRLSQVSSHASSVGPYRLLVAQHLQGTHTHGAPGDKGGHGHCQESRANDYGNSNQPTDAKACMEDVRA